MSLRRAFRNFPKTAAELDRLLRDVDVADRDITTDQLQENTVTNAILADMTALSVKARSANTSGDPVDLAASADGQYLQRNSDLLQFAGIATADVTADHITQHMAAIRSFLPRPEPRVDEFQLVMANRVFGAR